MAAEEEDEEEAGAAAAGEDAGRRPIRATSLSMNEVDEDTMTVAPTRE